MIELGVGAHSTPVVSPAPANGIQHGDWLATVSFRPSDDDEVMYTVEAFGATHDEALAAVMKGLDDERGREVQTIGVDGPACREFIEAASHMHDLRGAARALELADAAEDSAVAGLLRAQAVTLFGRTFSSNVRRALSQFISMSDTDVALVDRLRILRNRNTAHSENTMTVTMPLLDLERQVDNSIAVRMVRAVTFENPMPTPFVAEFAALLERLIVQLTDALQPLKLAVTNETSAEQLETLFARPELMQMLPVPASDWSPDDRRPAFPASRFAPIHIVPSDESITDLTITR